MSKFSRGRVLGGAALALALGAGVGAWASSRTAGNGAEGSQRTAGADGHATAGDDARPAHAPESESNLYMVPVSNSQPATGASDPLVTIVQWCDLPDRACAAFEPALQGVLARHANDVRLVFRHYLVDPSHTASLHAHHFARAAHEQAGKFWEARALLLGHDPARGELTLDVLEGYAKQLGLDWARVRSGLEQGGFGAHVTGDRLFADMFEVTATPTFFVNGRPLRKPTAQALEALVVEEAEHARKVVASGVPKAELYAELVKKGTWVKPPRRPR